MSAFICDNKTISAIALAFVQYQVSFDGLPPKSGIDIVLVDLHKEATRIGQALLEQNYASVNYRYRENTETPEFVLEDVKIDEGIVIGCMECYEYQACETDDWKNSYIRNNLLRLQQKILYRLLYARNMHIPYGYDGFNMMEG
ncbi:MAG: hypothetical protein IKP50_00430 [Bacilli bacterium]|nr:hypothetical protein [Bacilli bacterium]